MSGLSATDLRVAGLLLTAARASYIDEAVHEDVAPVGIPVDRRCPACGVDRPVCASASCIRKPEATPLPESVTGGGHHG